MIVQDAMILVIQYFQLFLYDLFSETRNQPINYSVLEPASSFVESFFMRDVLPAKYTCA
jgi:hypothetical protein